MKVGPWQTGALTGWVRMFETGALAASVCPRAGHVEWVTYDPKGMRAQQAMVYDVGVRRAHVARDQADEALRRDGHELPRTETPATGETARAAARAARRDRQRVFAEGVAHGKARFTNTRGRLRGDAALARVLGSETLLWRVVDALRRGDVPDARYMHKRLVRGLSDDELLAELEWRERLRELRAAKTARSGRLGALVSRWVAATTEAVRILAGRAS